MNKMEKFFVEDLGFKYIQKKSNMYHFGTCFGTYRGFNFIVKVFAQNIFISFGYNKENAKSDVNNLIMSLKKNKKLKTISVESHDSYILMNIRPGKFFTSFETYIYEQLDTIVEILQEKGYSNGSFLYGQKNEAVKPVLVGEEYVFYTEYEYNEKKRLIEQNCLENEETKENFFLGFLFAFAVCIFSVTFMAAVTIKTEYSFFIIPFFASTLMVIVYKYFAKKITYKSIIILLPLVLLLGILPIFIHSVYGIYNYFNLNGVSITVYQAIDIVFEIEIKPLFFPSIGREYMIDFIKDAGFNTLAAIIGYKVSISKSLKKEARNININWVEFEAE